MHCSGALVIYMNRFKSGEPERQRPDVMGKKQKLQIQIIGILYWEMNDTFFYEGGGTY